MARSEFLTQLSRVRRVTIDTCVCVYHLDVVASSERRRLVAQLFDLGLKGAVEIDLPGIARMEMMVGPLKKGDQLGVVKIRRLIGQPGVRPTPITEEVLMKAAEVRAETMMKAPDALVAASAIMHGSELIIGNDGDFKHFEGLSARTRGLPQFIRIDDYVGVR